MDSQPKGDKPQKQEPLNLKNPLHLLKSIFIDYPGKPAWRQVFDTLLSALILALIIKFTIIQAFYIPSGSMRDTLEINDRILVSRVQYYYREPRRREIIVFWFPKMDKHYIKRVVGVPGDRIEVRQKQLYVNGVLQDEPYAVHKDPRLNIRGANYAPITVPKGKFFAMGDNRDQSEDSRFWDDPFVPKKEIVGKAIFIYWPFGKVGLVR